MVGNGANLFDVGQNTRNILAGGFGQIQRVLGVKKRVGAVFEKRLVHVHAATVYFGNGFRHKRGIHAVGGRNLFADGAVRNHLVGHFHSFVVAQVNFVLRRGHFVVGIFHADAEFLKHLHRVAADGIGTVQRNGVKVAGTV